MEHQLCIRNLCYSFQKKDFVLNKINFQAENGIYGILGPNGAGKTTLFRCILNLYKNGGEISLDGVGKDQKEYPYMIGYVPQIFSAYPYLKVGEMMEYFAGMQKVESSRVEERIEDCLKKVNLESKRNQRIRTLSGGMLRRLAIAQAMLNEPALILLDEPTTGLDPEERSNFLEILKLIQRDYIILIATHYIEDIEQMNDCLVVLDHSNIVYQGIVGEFCRTADSHTYVVEEQKLQHISGDYKIIRREEGLFRILTKEKQMMEAAAPLLEDAYLLLTLKEWKRNE